MTPPAHHPTDETLLAYAAGTLPNVISCVVACHLSLCAKCAGETRFLRMVGGVMLTELETQPADEAAMNRMAERLVAEPLPERRPEPAQPPPGDPWMPLPLSRYLGMRGEEVPWKTVVKGVRQHWIKLPRDPGQLRLLRLAPGKTLLEHTHTGMELTMVLQGSYGDHTGAYLRGDIIEWEEGTDHQPRAFGAEECICLIASENIPYFHRLIARLLRPIMGF